MMDLGLALPLCVLWNSIFYLVLNSFEIVTHMAVGTENQFFFPFTIEEKRSWPRKSAWRVPGFCQLMFQMLWIFYKCSFHSDYHKGMKCYLEMQSEPCILPRNFKTLATGTLTPPTLPRSISVTDWAPSHLTSSSHSEDNSPASITYAPFTLQLSQAVRPGHKGNKGTITTQWRSASEAQHHWPHAVLG